MSFDSLLEKVEEKEPVSEPTTKLKGAGFDSLAAKVERPDSVSSQARSNVNVSGFMTPEQEAEAYHLSKETGLPISTVRLQPQLVREKSLYKATAVKSVNEYLAADIGNAAISKDDVPNLERAEKVLTGNLPLGPRMGTLEELPEKAPERVTTLSRLLTETPTVGGIVKTAGAALATGAAQVPKSLGDMFDFFAPYIVDKRKLDFADKNLEKITLSADLQEHLRSTYGETKAEELVGSAFESLGTMGALLATLGGGAVLPGMSAIAGVEKTTEAIEEDRANRTTAVVAGITQAATEYLTEKIPIDILRAPAVSFMSKFARGAAFDVPGELIATATEMWLIDQEMLGGEHKTLDEYKQALVDTALVSVIVTGAATAPTHGIQKLQGKVDTEIIRRQVESLQKDKAYQDKLNADRTAISETLTYQRSADHAKRFIETVGADQDVYVSAEGMKQLFQSHTKEETDALLEKIGIAPDKAQAAIATGVDTTIKSKELLTLTEDEYNIIKEDVKPAPGAYTQREITEGAANEDIENLVNLVKEDVEKSNLINTEITRIQEEGKKAGLTEELSTNAPLLIQGIANKLELENVDSVEFLKKISLKKERFADIKALIEKGKQIFQADIKEPKRVVAPRGMLTIEEEAYTISLFEDADLSTVLHEVGHIALNEYTNLETLGQASESLVRDMGVIREWVGAEKGQDFTTPQLEQFARGFEAYLLEGKAPTSSLREAFERFKRWMVETYKTVTGLDVKLTPQVRQVFDRMLSTNLEVEAAAAENGFIVKTKDEMNALGMTKPDQVFATRLMEIVDRKAKRRLAKERNKSLRANRKSWKEEARREIRQENPAYNTIDSIIADDNRIDITEFIERYGEDAINLLPNRRVLSRKVRVKSVNGKVVPPLSSSRMDTLENVRVEIELGEPARRTPVTDKEGNITRWTVDGGTYPEYFKGKGYTKKEALNIINKALKGLSLTKRQQIMLDDLSDGYDDLTQRQIEADRATAKSADEFPFGEFAGEQFEQEVSTEELPQVVVFEETGDLSDEIAILYGYTDSNAMIEDFFATPKLTVAVNQRVAEKQAAHDAQFRAEDYFVDLKEYRDYLNIMARYIGGRTVDEAVINEGIQRNTPRWEKEARAEIAQESPELTGTELDDAINARVEQRVDNYRVQKARPSTVSIDTIKDLARRTMAATTVRDARRVDKYMSAMKKASSDERRAILRKDWGAASTASELARFNYEMASLSVKVREEVDTIQKRAKRIGKPKKKETIDVEHKQAILHLTSRFNLAPYQPSDPLKIPDYAKLFAGDEFGSKGFDSIGFLSSSARDFRELSTEQLRDLDKAIRYLEGQGNIDNKTFLSTGERLEDIGRGSIEEMDAQKQRKDVDQFSKLSKVKAIQMEQFARMMGMPFITQALGGYKSLKGVISFVETHIMERLRDIRDAQFKRFREERLKVKPLRDHIIKSQRKLIKKHGRKLFVADNGVPVPAVLQNNGKQLNYWTPQQIFSMAFNRGNDSNTNALLRGFPGLTLGQVDTLLDRYLTKEDMDVVQDYINAINKLAPEVDAVHVRMKNYHMERVESRPWIFKGKEYKGGYYPLAIDRKLASKQNNLFNTLKEEQDFFESNDAKYTTPYADASHTMNRNDGHGLPVDLRLVVADKHIDKAVRYITMAEGIKDIVRILNYQEVERDAFGTVTKREGFKQSAIRIMGEDVYNQIAPAIKYFANPVVPGIDTSGYHMVAWMRRMAASAHLALRTITGVKQLSSIVGGINQMSLGDGGGFKAYTKGAAYVAFNASKAYSTMLDKSPNMQERQNAYERDILKSRFDTMKPKEREVVWGDRSVSWQDVKDAAFLNIRIPDLIATTPIWWGSYIDRIEKGFTEKQAVRYADNVVDITQPTAQPLNLSDWLRDGGYLGLFNPHQTYTVGIYGQRQRSWYRAWRAGEISTGKYAQYNFIEGILPNFLMVTVVSLLKGGDLGDPDEQIEILIDTLLNWTLMGTPMILSFIDAITEGWHSPTEVIGTREAEKWIQTGHFLYTHTDGMTDKERKRALYGVGDIFSDILQFPASRVTKQILEGDTVMEKLFGPRKKKK